MNISFLLIINVLLMIFFFVVAYMAIKYFLNQIEKYPKITLEEIYDSKKLRQKYGIENIVNPRDFGFDYKEVAYKSGKIQLYGWLIENKNSNKAIILSHGRGTNRLGVLRYLNLFKELRLNEQYNIFIPDLRNSGKSDSSKTFMGYCFGQDIYHTMEMLNNDCKLSNFILYGFSQGAIGSAIAAKFYNDQLRTKGIKIEKMILDSPVSNVKKKLKDDARKRKVPKFILSIVIRVFSIRVGGHLNKMHLAYLLRRIPTLLLQSKQDGATPYGMLMGEYTELSQNKNVVLKVFENGTHTRIYPDYVEEYTKTVSDFLNGNQKERKDG